MFNSRSFTPLIFFFEVEARKKNAIHSFFCPPFIATFINSEKKVVEVREVLPWNPLIIPKKKFKYLIESPINNVKFKEGDELSWA